MERSPDAEGRKDGTNLNRWEAGTEDPEKQAQKFLRTEQKAFELEAELADSEVADEMRGVGRRRPRFWKDLRIFMK